MSPTRRRSAFLSANVQMNRQRTIPGGALCPTPIPEENEDDSYHFEPDSNSNSCSRSSINSQPSSCQSSSSNSNSRPSNSDENISFATGIGTGNATTFNYTSTNAVTTSLKRGRPKKGQSKPNKKSRTEKEKVVIKTEPIPDDVEYLERIESLQGECEFLKQVRKEDKVWEEVVIYEDEEVIESEETDFLKKLKFSLIPHGKFTSDEAQKKESLKQFQMICDNIFGALSLGMVKTCRSVSKFWRYASTPNLKDRTQINFYDKYSRKDFNQDLFLRYLNKNAKSVEVIQNVLLETISDKTFFLEIGKHIKSLSLEKFLFKPPNTFEGAQNYKNLWHVLTTECPNLKSLTIRQYQAKSSGKVKLNTNEFLQNDGFKTPLQELILFNSLTNFNFREIFEVIIKRSYSLRDITFYCRSVEEFTIFKGVIDSISDYSLYSFKTLKLFWVQHNVPYKEIFTLSSNVFKQIKVISIPWIPIVRNLIEGRRNIFKDPQDLKYLEVTYLDRSKLKHYLRLEYDENSQPTEPQLLLSRERKPVKFDSRKNTIEFFMIEPLPYIFPPSETEIRTYDVFDSYFAEICSEHFNAAEYLNFINPPSMDFYDIFQKFTLYLVVSKIRMVIDVNGIYALNCIFDPLMSIQNDNELDKFKDLKELIIEVSSFDKYMPIERQEGVCQGITKLPIQKLTLANFKLGIDFIQLLINKVKTLEGLHLPNSILVSPEGRNFLIEEEGNIISKVFTFSPNQ